MAVSVKAVVLDLDGTILDHEGSVVRALHAWLPTLGRAGDPHLVHAWFAAEKRHFPAWQAGETSFAEQRRRRLRDFLPLIDAEVGDADHLDSVFAGYLAHYESAWQPFDDVDPALDQLAEAGYVPAVLTNGATDQQNAKLRALGLAHRVGPVLTAEDLGVAKPDPDAYRRTCARLDLDPAEVLHVGDLHDVDVLAARAAGLQAVHLDRSERRLDPDRIARLTELARWLSPDRVRARTRSRCGLVRG